jgi:hypothetical protein
MDKAGHALTEGVSPSVPFSFRALMPVSHYDAVEGVEEINQAILDIPCVTA